MCEFYNLVILQTSFQVRVVTKTLLFLVSWFLWKVFPHWNRQASHVKPRSLQITYLPWVCSIRTCHEIHLFNSPPKIFSSSRLDNFFFLPSPAGSPSFLTQINPVLTPTPRDKMSCFGVNHCLFLLLNIHSYLACVYECGCVLVPAAYWVPK